MREDARVAMSRYGSSWSARRSLAQTSLFTAYLTALCGIAEHRVTEIGRAHVDGSHTVIGGGMPTAAERQAAALIQQ